MSRLIVTQKDVAFPLPPQVETLLGETFTQREVAEALGVPVTKVIDAVTRFQMFLMSDRVHGSSPRRFHFFDCYLLLIFLGFAKEFGPVSRKTLVAEVSGLLFGEQISEGEVAWRRAKMAAEWDASTPSGRAKKGGQFFLEHLARRDEIRKDPISAHPLFWSRNYNEHFVLFGRADHRLLVAMFDRRDGAKVDAQPFAVPCWSRPNVRIPAQPFLHFRAEAGAGRNARDGHGRRRPSREGLADRPEHQCRRLGGPGHRPLEVAIRRL
jgi:hypothetical protein